MKYSELASKKEGEEKELLKERTTRLSELLFLRAQGKLKNVKEIRAVRKDIARIKTYDRAIDQKSNAHIT